MKDENKSQILEFEAKELELSELKQRLKMTPEERIAAHENARQLAEDLHLAGNKLRAKSQQTT
jgi:hypothetical protein